MEALKFDLATIRDEYGCPTPLAVWPEHGTLELNGSGRLEFRSFTRPEEAESWPMPGPAGVDVLRRLARDILRDRSRIQWTVLPALRPFVDAAHKAEEATRAREHAAELARARERQAEDALRARLAARYADAGRGWRTGRFQVSHRDGTRPEVSGLVHPSGLFAIQADTDPSLTHIPTGLVVARGTRQALKILAARLLDVRDGSPVSIWISAPMPSASLELAAPIVNAFKQTGNPLAPTEAEIAEALKAK